MCIKQKYFLLNVCIYTHMSKCIEQGQTNRTRVKVLSLQVMSLGLISGIPYGPSRPAHFNPETQR